MNKGIIATIIVLLVVGIGGYFFYFSSKMPEVVDKKDATSTSVEKAQYKGEDTTSIGGKFTDLLKLGKDYTCDFSYVSDDEGVTSEGKVYMTASGQRMRGDFVTTDSEGTSTTSSMISDGTYLYTWTDSIAQGYKMEIPDGDTAKFYENLENDAMDKDSTSDNSFNMSAYDDVEYECVDWNVNENVFTPPENVEFVDFSAQLDSLMESFKGSMEGDSPAPGLDCSVCENVPEGSSRDQCLQALGC